MNTINLIGRFGKDHEVRATQSGKVVLSNTLAVNANYGEGTNWIDIKIWNKPAEATEKYTKKGSLVGVTGELRQESWENAEGQKRSKLVVNVNKIEFLDSKKEKKENYDDIDLDDFDEVTDEMIPF